MGEKRRRRRRTRVRGEGAPIKKKPNGAKERAAPSLIEPD